MADIQKISRKNYKYRIHLKNRDEFGQMATAFNAMAERLEYFESSNLNKLIFEKARAEAVINSLKDASIGINRNNTILFANQQALQLLGLKTEDTIGRPVGELSARNDLLRFLISDDTNKPFKIVVDGKENYYTKEVIEVAQSDTTSKVIVLKNITSFKELDVAKTNFIATVSHELKTPLASSDFSLKLLEDERVGTLTTEQKELVQNLKEDNKRLLRILSELLDMSQVESGKIQLNLQPVQPIVLIDKTVQSVHNVAKEKNISIKKEIAENLPAIQADADKTVWVLNNFLTNSIRYSPADSNIIVTAKKMDNNIQFSVQD